MGLKAKGGCKGQGRDGIVLRTGKLRSASEWLLEDWGSKRKGLRVVIDNSGLREAVAGKSNLNARLGDWPRQGSSVVSSMCGA